MLITTPTITSALCGESRFYSIPRLEVIRSNKTWLKYFSIYFVYFCFAFLMNDCLCSVSFLGSIQEIGWEEHL